MPARKPSVTQKNWNNQVALSKRHAQRLSDGRMESEPGEYRLSGSDEDVRLRDARRKFEDRKLLRELGLKEGEVEL